MIAAIAGSHVLQASCSLRFLTHAELGDCWSRENLAQLVRLVLQARHIHATLRRIALVPLVVDHCIGWCRQRLSRRERTLEKQEAITPELLYFTVVKVLIDNRLYVWR